MKVLFISNDPTIFDEGSMTRARMRTYANAFGELFILSRGSGTETHEGNLHLYPVAVPKLVSVPVLARRARRLVQDETIEVVSAQDPFEYGLIALKAARGTGATLHIQVHTDFLSPWFARGWGMPALLNRIRVLLADRVIPSASGVRVVSERVKRSLQARYGNRMPEPAVIPIAVPEEQPPAAPLPKTPFSFAFMAIGRLEAEKRVGDILRALSIVAARHPEAGLFVVHDGRLRAVLEAQARSLGLSEHVRFLGSRSDARGLLASAQAFVQASAYEGYGRTLIEAALAGIPIITTDTGIVGDILISGEDVLAVEPGDVRGLADRMQAVIEDRTLSETLAANARAKALAHLEGQHAQLQLMTADLARTLEKR